jgi:serine/threonine protein kinase
MAALVKASGDNRPFLERYEMHEKIGKGAYATVHRCIRRADGKVFAVKNIDVRPLRLSQTFDPERLFREVKITERLMHPNIIKLEDTCWTRSDGSPPSNPQEWDRLLLVLEFAPGKELFDEILQRGRFSEEDSRKVMSKVLNALIYIHSLNIVHRDIKPENILLTETGEVKLLDFGLSRTVGSGSYAKTFAGTPEYYAPEVDPKRRLGGMREGYGVKADCWSFGACLYVMLSGIFPEYEAGDTGFISFDRSSHWGSVSAEAKDLIKRLMHPHPEGRPTSEQVATHPWFTGDVLPPAADEQRSSIQSLAVTHESGKGLEGDRDRSMSSDRKRKAEPPVRKSSGVIEMEVDTSGSSETRQQGFTDYNGDMIYKLRNLIGLQLQVESLFGEAYTMSSGNFRMAISLNAKSSNTLLQKAGAMMDSLGSTATELNAIISDLKLAVMEGEPELAAQMFNNIRGYVSEMRQRAKGVMDDNSQLMLKLNYTCEAALQRRLPSLADGSYQEVGVEKEASSPRLKDLKSSPVNFPIPLTPPPAAFEVAAMVMEENSPSNSPPESPPLVKARMHEGSGGDEDAIVKKINFCVQKLSEVDAILQEFTSFWTGMDNAMLGVYQKNQHVESMLNYTHNRKLRDRFFTRLDEYEKLWQEISQVCRVYRSEEAERVKSAYKFVPGTPGMPKKTTLLLAGGR